MGTRATREDPQKRVAYQDIFSNDLLGDPLRFRPWLDRWRMITGDRLLAASRCLMERDDIRTRLKEILCPAIIFHGLEDTHVPPAHGELLHMMLSGSVGYIPIPGAGHAASLTHPELLNPPLLQFLRANA